MELLFNADNFKKRLKTEFLDEKGNLYYWGIYDFSYKYRTRIYDKDSQEIYYVEKDIYDNNLVNLFDYKGNKVGEIIRKDGTCILNEYVFNGDIDDGKADNLFIVKDNCLTILDDDKAELIILFIFGLVEMKEGA